jgi:GR25 family glycosyltransferase involved in LPS biosynthesis
MDFNMNVSLICACKNRNAPLKISLSSWLLFKEITEIIIVDWSSDESLRELTDWDERIKVINVPNQTYFNQPQPLNLAANVATGDYILKVDTDYILNPYFNFFEHYKIDNESFLCGQNDYEQVEINSSPYFKYLRGLLYISRENYLKVGGFNEIHTQYYAYEDDEISHRLELLGLKKHKVEYNHNIIHIPHPDKKRLENFEAYHTDKNLEMNVRNMLSSYYKGDELEWQIEYVLAQQHIEINRQKSLSEIASYYFKSDIVWNLEKVTDQFYIASKNLNNKLNKFPKAYFMTLEESAERQKNIKNQFLEYGIKITPVISKRFSESNDTVVGKYLFQLNSGTAGCCVSHLKAIKKWYDETEDEYAFFCEDDLSLETVQYWDFTWEEFIKNLPNDWDVVQLVTIREDFGNFKVRERYWDDWSATAYIITRDYAKKIIDNYIKGDVYFLEIPNSNVMPLIENILFTTLGKCYTVPLFVEEVELESTFTKEQDNDVNVGQKRNHYHASKSVLEYWKSKNKISSLAEKTELENLLEAYSLDTENPDHNFNLGVWYENQGHTAPALSYFLRCAERATNSDPTLAYEALIRASYCYDKQGTRDGSARSLLWQAQMFLPSRPEAYFLLARFAQKREWWQDCYSTAELALIHCDFNLPPLKTDVEYPGKQGILFAKGVSGWWWGKVEESRSLLLNILKEYTVSEKDKDILINNLAKMGVEV